MSTGPLQPNQVVSAERSPPCAWRGVAWRDKPAPLHLPIRHNLLESTHFFPPCQGQHPACFEGARAEAAQFASRSWPLLPTTISRVSDELKGTEGSCLPGQRGSTLPNPNKSILRRSHGYGPSDPRLRATLFIPHPGCIGNHPPHSQPPDSMAPLQGNCRIQAVTTWQR